MCKTHDWVQGTTYICERGEKVGKTEAERKIQKTKDLKNKKEKKETKE